MQCRSVSNHPQVAEFKELCSKKGTTQKLTDFVNQIVFVGVINPANPNNVLFCGYSSTVTVSQIGS